MLKLLGMSLLLLTSGLHAQNLIPNPGFEQCDLCDSRGVKELGIGIGANIPADWNAATFGTPDFQSVTPRSGKHHGGFFTGFGKFEYLANRFNKPLAAGARYRFSFWIRPATHGSNNFAVDEMGVYFQKGMPDYRQAEPLKQLVPHYATTDNEHLQGEYQLVRFEYTACGAEDHFIIGRFRALESGDTTFIGTKRPANPSAEAIYYFVDDFEMIELEPPVVIDLLPETIVLCPDEKKSIRIPAPYDQEKILWSTGENVPEIVVPRNKWLAVEVQLNDRCKTILRDTTEVTLIDKVNIKILSADSVCIGDTIELKAICNGRCFDFSWNTGSTMPNLIITEPGRYSITAKTACEDLETSKDIAASGKMVGAFVQFPNVFAPNGEEKNRSFGPVLEPGESHRLIGLHFMVYNRWGQKLFETRDQDERWHPDTDVPMESYIYFCEIEYQDCNQIRKSVLKGTTSLIR